MEFTDAKVERLRFYGKLSDQSLLDWSWVEHQLIGAGTYWVIAKSAIYPHPRPVWGIWFRKSLYLSIGSQILVRCIETSHEIAVHLESGTDVVIVEGNANVSSEPDLEIIDAYNAKYGWQYTIDQYGPLTRVDPMTIISWRSGGQAGRDGFQEVGRWRFG